MGPDPRGELLERIDRAARAGLISAVDREIRSRYVRDAHSPAELELIGRDLDRLQAPVSSPATGAVPAPGAEPAPSAPPMGSAGILPSLPVSSYLGSLGRPERRVSGPRWGLAPVLLVAVFVMAVAVTMVYRVMRAVMDVGGACASGGPYVSAQPCPDGTWVIGAAIPVLVVAALIGSVLAVGLRAPSPLLVMWAALFGALGWNFFEYGRRAGSVGLLVCAIVFWLMAAPAAFGLIFGGALKRRIAGSEPRDTRTVFATWAWLAAYLLVGGVGTWFGSQLWNQVG